MRIPASLYTGLVLASLSEVDAFLVHPRTTTTTIHAVSRSNQQMKRRQLRDTSTDVNDRTTTSRIYSQTDSSPEQKSEVLKPDILEPFPLAADPQYKCTAPVGEGEFLVSRTGEPTQEELANENMLKIVRIQSTDLEVNTLVWKCLGYRFVDGTWQNDEVFPNWRERYPEPPDFIGMQRTYTKEIDGPSLRSNQSLVRSIPLEHKQSLKPALKPLGFSGYKYAELTPNKTRRAQCANWLIYYRDHLFGYTVEELRERRAQEKKRLAEEEAAAKEAGTEEDDFKPPVREVF